MPRWPKRLAKARDAKHDMCVCVYVQENAGQRPCKQLQVAQKRDVVLRPAVFLICVVLALYKPRQYKGLSDDLLQSVRILSIFIFVALIILDEPTRVQIKLTNFINRISWGETGGKFCEEIVQCRGLVCFAGGNRAQIVIL
jgi:hypothetical protein